MIPEEEVKQLKEDAKQEMGCMTPRCYIPIWVPVESPAERIERAKEHLANVKISQAEADTSSKDTDSNGKKEYLSSKLVNGLAGETGLTPVMRKLSVGSKPEDQPGDASPKAKRERRKSKSKSEEKTSEGEVGESPKTPTKVAAGGEGKSLKKSPEKGSKIPVKINTTKEQEETSEKKIEEVAPAV